MNGDVCFLRGFGRSALLAAVVLIAINVTIDPRGYFLLYTQQGVNTEKVFADGGRIERSLRIIDGDYDALILGSSRAQIGINPGHVVFKPYKPYNLSMKATNIEELTRVLAFALDHQNIKAVVWGLDFLTFSTRRTVSQDFDRSLFANRPDLTTLCLYPISLSTLSQSILTVQANTNGKKALRNVHSGFTDKTGSNANHRRLFETILTENFMIKPDTYAGFKYGDDRVRKFERALDKLAARGARVHLFISPVHARQLEALGVMGLYPQFETWKRDLVAIVDRVNRVHGSRRTIELWDFSGFNTITTEPIPQTGDGRMTYYWESSHYKKATGDLILSRMLGNETDSIPEGFGQRLTHKNVEHHLATIRNGRAIYARTHPQEVADVRALAASTAQHWASTSDGRHGVWEVGIE